MPVLQTFFFLHNCFDMFSAILEELNTDISFYIEITSD